MAGKRDRSFTMPQEAKLKLGLTYIPDKDRFVTAPRPALNVVRLEAKLPDRTLILREWNFCEDEEGKTLKEINEVNWKKAQELFDQLARQLGKE